MANKDNARGLRVYQFPGGVPAVIKEFDTKASVTIYPGEPLELHTDGTVQKCSAATDRVFGVATGYMDEADMLANKYTFGKDRTKLRVIINVEDLLWRIQCDESGSAVAESDRGKFYKLALAAGDATTKQGRDEVDSSTGAADPGLQGTGVHWQLVDKANDAMDNDWGSANLDGVFRYRPNEDTDT